MLSFRYAHRRCKGWHDSGAPQESLQYVTGYIPYQRIAKPWTSRTTWSRRLWSGSHHPEYSLHNARRIQQPRKGPFPKGIWMREESYGCGTKAREVLPTGWIRPMRGSETAREKNTKGWQPLPAKARLPALALREENPHTGSWSKFCARGRLDRSKRQSAAHLLRRWNSVSLPCRGMGQIPL